MTVQWQVGRTGFGDQSRSVVVPEPVRRACNNTMIDDTSAGDTPEIRDAWPRVCGWIASSFAGGRLKGIPTSTALHVVERYERVSESTLMWEVTITDPNVYDAPWTMSMPLTAETDYQIFEYACHEGNYAVPNALSGSRYLEKNPTDEQ